MDEVDVLLQGLAREEVPAESLQRVAAGVRSKLLRRRYGRWGLVAALLAVGWFASLQAWSWRKAEELPGPVLSPLALPALELAIPPPSRLPPISQQRPRRRLPKVVGEGLVQLPSSDPNVLILWDLKEEASGGLQ
jgi:hypothetical protein